VNTHDGIRAKLQACTAGRQQKNGLAVITHTQSSYGIAAWCGQMVSADLEEDEADVGRWQLALGQEAQILCSLASKGLMRPDSRGANDAQVPGRLLCLDICCNALIQPAGVDLVLNKIRAL